MIEYKEVKVYLSNMTIWDIYLSDVKIGSLKKETPHKRGKTFHGGKYYLNVLGIEYVLPLSFRGMVNSIVQMNLDRFESALIMKKLEQTEWHKNRIARWENWKKINAIGF